MADGQPVQLLGSDIESVAELLTDTSRINKQQSRYIMKRVSTVRTQFWSRIQLCVKQDRGARTVVVEQVPQLVVEVGGGQPLPKSRHIRHLHNLEPCQPWPPKSEQPCLHHTRSDRDRHRHSHRSQTQTHSAALLAASHTLRPLRKPTTDPAHITGANQLIETYRSLISQASGGSLPGGHNPTLPAPSPRNTTACSRHTYQSPFAAPAP